MTRAATIATCLLLAAAHSAYADDDARTRFDAEVASIYDYLPSQVDESVRTAKAAEMDRFWELVRSDTGTYVPLLREALRKAEQNVFFRFDGAALLADVSEEPDDLQLAADSVARSNLAEVSSPGFFRLVHDLGVRGADASDAALMILEKPKFGVMLPAHAMTLQQQQCLLLCLLPMEESLWVPKVVERFERATDRSLRSVLLRMLVVAVDPDADAVVGRVAEDENAPDRLLRTIAQGAVRRAQVPAPDGEPSTTREAFDAVLAECVEKGRVPYSDEARPAVEDALFHVRASDVPQLRQARRRIARRVSDESLLEVQQVTRWLRRAVAADDAADRDD